jgi:hypothetical protein
MCRGIGRVGRRAATEAADGCGGLRGERKKGVGMVKTGANGIGNGKTFYLPNFLFVVCTDCVVCFHRPLAFSFESWDLAIPLALHSGKET